MDLTESNIIGSQCVPSTTVPVRYTVDAESVGHIDESDKESAAEVEYQLNEIYTTDDENKNYLIKSAYSDVDISTSQNSESESDFCEQTNNNRINCVKDKTRNKLLPNGKVNLIESNGHISTPRYSITNGTSSFKLTIPSIQEDKESADSSDFGINESSSSSISSTSKTKLQKQQVMKNNLSVKNISTKERRLSYAGISTERRSSVTSMNKDQKQTRIRRRFSISVSSSDDDSSSSSGSEEQIKIEQYMQSRQRRRHSMATTSNELIQAMSLLMSRRASGKGNNLIPMLANALVKLANSESGDFLDPEKHNHKHQRHSAPPSAAPVIKVNEESGYVCHSCKVARPHDRPKSPVDLLRRPHSPISDCSSNDNSEYSDHNSKYLSPDVDVLRILTTRSPCVSEDDDTDSDSQNKKQQRRKSRSNRKSTSTVPQISRANKPNGVSLLSPTTSKSQPRRSSFSSVTSSSTSRGQSRRSSLSTLNTPPPSKTQSRRSSLHRLQASESVESDNVLRPDELRKRLENAVSTPSCDSESQITLDVSNTLPSIQLEVPDGSSDQTPQNQSDVPNGRSQKRLTLSLDGRMSRRASMCVPSVTTHHSAANPPSSLEEEEQIRRRATQRGRRRSSWAGSFPMSSSTSVLAEQLRATSPMTLLRESKYYGKLKNLRIFVKMTLLHHADLDLLSL